MKHGAHMEIKHPGNNTAWGWLYRACKSLYNGESRALSVPTTRSLTDLPAVVAHWMPALSPAAESWPVRQVAAHGAFFACTSKGMSTSHCHHSWWWGVICLHGTRSALIQSEAPGSALPDTNVRTLGDVWEICFLHPSRFLRKPVW